MLDVYGDAADHWLCQQNAACLEQIIHAFKRQPRWRLQAHDRCQASRACKCAVFLCGASGRSLLRLFAAAGGLFNRFTAALCALALQLQQVWRVCLGWRALAKSGVRFVALNAFHRRSKDESTVVHGRACEKEEEVMMRSQVSAIACAVGTSSSARSGKGTLNGMVVPGNSSCSCLTCTAAAATL